MYEDRYTCDLFHKLPLGYILRDYVEKGIPGGGFIDALLSNDLSKTFGRADLINRERLFEYVSWLYSYAPRECWGSEQNVNKWIEHSGLQGLTKTKATIE